MALSISLPEDKARRWAEVASTVAISAPIPHNDLEKLVAELAFPQTSIFGKFGRAMPESLFDKLKDSPYVPHLSAIERDACHWWAGAILHHRPRMVRHKSGFPDYIIYAEAVTSTRILDAVDSLLHNVGISASFDFCETPPDPEWVAVFDPTEYTLGLEMLTVLANFLRLGPILRDRSVALYMGNPNTRDALMHGSPDTGVARKMVRIFRKMAHGVGISVWIEYVHSGVDNADLPTRNVKLHFPLSHPQNSRFFHHLRPL